MQTPRKTWMTALCLGMAFLFFAQITLCFAADTGAAGCCYATAQDADSGATGKCDPSHTSHCCHAHGHSVLPTADSRLVPESAPSGMVFHSDDSLPDGPVSEIDLPPQLS